MSCGWTRASLAIVASTLADDEADQIAAAVAATVDVLGRRDRPQPIAGAARRSTGHSPLAAEGGLGPGSRDAGAGHPIARVPCHPCNARNADMPRTPRGADLTRDELAAERRPMNEWQAWALFRQAKTACVSATRNNGRSPRGRPRPARIECAGPHRTHRAGRGPGGRPRGTIVNGTSRSLPSARPADPSQREQQGPAVAWQVPGAVAWRSIVVNARYTLNGHSWRNSSSIRRR